MRQIQRRAVEDESKRKRAQVTRGVQYAILVAVILIIAVTANWDRVGHAFFDIPVAKADVPTVKKLLGKG